MCRLDSILKGSDFNTAPEVDLRKFISFIFTLHGHQQRSNDCINPPNGKMVIQNYAHTEYDINSQELKVFSRHPFNKNGLKIVGAVSVIFVQPIGIGKKILVSSYLVRLERNTIWIWSTTQTKYIKSFISTCKAKDDKVDIKLALCLWFSYHDTN